MGEARGPHRRPKVAVALLLLAVVATLIQINVLNFAFRRLGLSEGWALLLLTASILGGAVNIPVGQLPARWTAAATPIVERRIGDLIIIERPPARRTALAVNLGGALIPVALSVYLVVATSLYAAATLGVAFVAVLVHVLAKVEPGVGVIVPAFVPALLAVSITVIVHPAAAAAMAYVSGTLGTLLGADLANVTAVAKSAPNVVSIGGAGSLDGIVLAGVVAVVLVALL